MIIWQKHFQVQKYHKRGKIPPHKSLPKTYIFFCQNPTKTIDIYIVARHILYPAILACLLDVNVASRKGLGTSEGIRLAMNFHRICKVKYKTYYILKCDKRYGSFYKRNLENCKQSKISCLVGLRSTRQVSLYYI